MTWKTLHGPGGDFEQSETVGGHFAEVWHRTRGGVQEWCWAVKTAGGICYQMAFGVEPIREVAMQVAEGALARQAERGGGQG